MTTMPSRRSAPILRAATRRLRQLSLAAAEGEFLGSEQELTELLGVSRPTFRQAVRLLEHDNLLVKRMGAKGGCYAARPDLGTVARSASLVLQAEDATLFDMVDASASLRDRAIRGAAECRDAALRAEFGAFLAGIDPHWNAAEIGAFLQLERRFEQLVFRMAANPALTMFSEISRRFVDDHPASQALISQAPMRRLRVQAWLRIGTAILAGDGTAALAIARQQAEVFRALIPPESGRSAIGEPTGI